MATWTDFFFRAAFEFDGNTLSHSGGKHDEGNLVSRHIMVPIYQPISPQTTHRQDRDLDAKSLSPALAFDLYSATSVAYCRREVTHSCFLPPSFSPFLFLLLLFLLGGWGTSRFLVPGRDDVTCGGYCCSTAGPRGGRWAAGSPTGIPAGKMR